MNAYEKMVSIMRKEGAYQNDMAPGIGIYKAGKVEFAGLKLEEKDLLVSSSLIFDETRYWTHRQNNIESALYLDEREIVKEGDMLAIFYEKSRNKFVVLAKVVEL